MVEKSEASIRQLAPDPADTRAVPIMAGGAFDRSSRLQLTAAVRDALAIGTHHVVVDVEHATSIDAATIGALLTCRALALAAGGSLSVVNDNGIVAQVLDLTGTRRSLCPPAPNGPVPAVRPVPKPGPSSTDSARQVTAEVIETSAALLARAGDLVAASRELMNRIVADRDADSARRTSPDGEKARLEGHDHA
ncbi:hypothetical protein Aab01nite_58220 [Paractinoplanes abujensis]|uniref:Anti-anti-sigma factor n=1 Tax=Paractinoplanes abujensis TaxID=882441 RepID=A0A7W7CX17_9ACTN|nr:STAS domain-containing protein [Actinoplanes abujensis]MBB4696239.1 anti-anti-sigma factor [Actinoplanes abujensis]GID22232.1 hypothetical protein Aab01nite_58220 [Actinoplanes abujensis]